MKDVQDYYRQNFVSLAARHPRLGSAEGPRGRELTEKGYAQALKIRATPTFIFYDLAGAEIVRIVGPLQTPEEFLLLGQFVASGAYKTRTFAQYKLETTSPQRQLTMPHNLFDSFKDLPLPSGRKGKYYSLAALEKAGPGQGLAPAAVACASCSNRCCATATASASPKSTCASSRRGSRRPSAPTEIPFVLARILLQDMAGFPSLNDFAAMRNAAKRLGGDPDAHRAARARSISSSTTRSKST